MSSDDVWGSSDEGRDGGAHDEGLETEWSNRRTQFWNSGYKDGLDVGKQQTLQEGFDKGYEKGITNGHRWGAARGAALTAEVLRRTHPQMPLLSAAIQQAVLRHSEAEVQSSICERLNNSPPSAPGSPLHQSLKDQDALLSELASLGKPYLALGERREAETKISQ